MNSVRPTEALITACVKAAYSAPLALRHLLLNDLRRLNKHSGDFLAAWPEREDKQIAADLHTRLHDFVELVCADQSPDPRTVAPLLKRIDEVWGDQDGDGFLNGTYALDSMARAALSVQSAAMMLGLVAGPDCVDSGGTIAACAWVCLARVEAWQVVIADGGGDVEEEQISASERLYVGLVEVLLAGPR